MQEFINFTLHYIADLDIPIKRSVCGQMTVLKEQSVHLMVSVVAKQGHLHRVPNGNAQCLSYWKEL